MEAILYLIVIVIAIILIIVIYKFLKPYFIRYDTTLLLTGGLGSGKTLTAVKKAVVLIRKQRQAVFTHNYIKRPFINAFRKIKAILKKQKKYEKIEKVARPYLYSNIPIVFKTAFWSFKKEKAIKLDKDHLILFKQIREYSVVFIDELPQLINQFNWNIKIVQDNINEFITFFRHYIGGYLIITAQATDDVVAQIRRKMNQAIWCFDFKRYHIFGWNLFYTIRMCDIMLNDDISTFTSTYIEDNTRLHWGLFPPKGTYDTRCYKERYNNILIKLNDKQLEKFPKIRTNEIIKIKEYKSPLDDYKGNELQHYKELTRMYEESKERTK